MLKNKRLLLIPPVLVLLAVVVLGLRIGYPYHRAVALGLWLLGWVPVLLSYRFNRRLVKTHRLRLWRRLRPYRAHWVAVVLLLGAFQVARVLFPVERSPLVDLTPETLRAELTEDFAAYRMLCRQADDWVAALRADGLLQRPVETLAPAERAWLRDRWREGITIFMEFDWLVEKYRGFYQVDHLAEPALHADAFMVACMAQTAQLVACLEVRGLAAGNSFIEPFLDEPGEGIPAGAFYAMKQRLTHPDTLLRIHAAWEYYKLVGRQVTFEEAVVADSIRRRKAFLQAFGGQAEMLIEHPLELLERAAFDALFPLQKNVALQMSRMRTATRAYYITPELVDEFRDRLQPGDMLLQRRNWHMTNVGIPGFWPHVALYVGTPAEIDAFFREAGINDAVAHLEARCPEAWGALQAADAAGRPMRVLEAIRPGVVFQSLETSARCDYLAVVRPRVAPAARFEALLAAFAYYGRPYDLNFDFATDNALVCSELVYKAYHAAASLPFQPEVVNGRILLPPNRMAEQMAGRMEGEDAAFTFVLFLDAVEKEGLVRERDVAAFRASPARPKWDLMQE